MNIETVNGVRLLHPSAGKVISNAYGGFYSELVYMGKEARIEDFVETDPPTPQEDDEPAKDMAAALRVLGVQVDG